MNSNPIVAPSQNDGTMLPLTLVAAVAENGVIGRDNALPWRLKSDMAHFRAVTMGKPVVMGRRCDLSITAVMPPARRLAVILQCALLATGGGAITNQLMS